MTMGGGAFSDNSELMTIAESSEIGVVIAIVNQVVTIHVEKGLTRNLIPPYGYDHKYIFPSWIQSKNY